MKLLIIIGYREELKGVHEAYIFYRNFIFCFQKNFLKSAKVPKQLDFNKSVKLLFSDELLDLYTYDGTSARLPFKVLEINKVFFGKK